MSVVIQQIQKTTSSGNTAGSSPAGVLQQARTANRFGRILPDNQLLKKKGQQVKNSLYKDTLNRFSVPQTVNTDTLTIVETSKTIAIKEIPVKSDIFFPEKQLLRPGNDWILGIVILALIIIASIRIASSNYLKNLFNSIVSYRTASRFFRERAYNLLHPAFRLDVLYFLVLAMFVFQILTNFGIAPQGINQILNYILGIGVVAVYHIYRRSIYLFSAFITESQAETAEFLFNMNNYNRVLGFFMLPLVLVIAFLPAENVQGVYFAGMGFIGLFYLLTLFRGAKILLKKQFSIYYLILYLCTLEFLPILLVLKFVVLDQK